MGSQESDLDPDQDTPSNVFCQINEENDFNSTQHSSLGNYRNNQQTDSTSTSPMSLAADGATYGPLLTQPWNFPLSTTEQNNELHSLYSYVVKPFDQLTLHPLYEDYGGSQVQIETVLLSAHRQFPSGLFLLF
jgi:hypothetical protein